MTRRAADGRRSGQTAASPRGDCGQHAQTGAHQRPAAGLGHRPDHRPAAGTGQRHAGFRRPGRVEGFVRIEELPAGRAIDVGGHEKLFLQVHALGGDGEGEVVGEVVDAVVVIVFPHQIEQRVEHRLPAPVAGPEAFQRGLTGDEVLGREPAIGPKRHLTLLDREMEAVGGAGGPQVVGHVVVGAAFGEAAVLLQIDGHRGRRRHRGAAAAGVAHEALIAIHQFGIHVAGHRRGAAHLDLRGQLPALEADLRTGVTGLAVPGGTGGGPQRRIGIPALTVGQQPATRQIDIAPAAEGVVRRRLRAAADTGGTEQQSDAGALQRAQRHGGGFDAAEGWACGRHDRLRRQEGPAASGHAGRATDGARLHRLPDFLCPCRAGHADLDQESAQAALRPAKAPAAHRSAAATARRTGRRAPAVRRGCRIRQSGRRRSREWCRRGALWTAGAQR